ncbi:MAG: L,D-transpeptidase family protein [Acidimicrobiales bacterium]
MTDDAGILRIPIDDFGPGDITVTESSLVNRRSHRLLRIVAAGGTAAVALAAIGVAGLLVLGRPGVSLSSSSPSAQALAALHVHGFATDVTAIEVFDAGTRIPVVERAGRLVPSVLVGQGRTLQVSVTITPPAWLHWLLGGPVTRTSTFRAPSAVPVTSQALVSPGDTVPVQFSGPVALVVVKGAAGGLHTLRLATPSRVVDVPVPRSASGAFMVAAAPLPWERLSPLHKVLWLRPSGGGPALAVASPAPYAVTSNADETIRLRFDEPVLVALGGRQPVISPRVAGTWSQPSLNTLVFRPGGFGYGPGRTVTVSFPRPVRLVRKGGRTATRPTTTYRFTTRPASLRGLEELLAELHYLPVKFTPAPGAREPTTLAGEIAAMSRPVPGHFSWRWRSVPRSLRTQWSTHSDSAILKGAIMAFDASLAGYDGYALTVEDVQQLANASTWRALIHAVLSRAVDRAPYDYVYVSQTVPETLTLWQNGKVILKSLANTGIAVEPTATGTFPIYVRYTVNTMSGTNPDGSKYDDIVYWINYFNGSDAVHGFPRATYGYPQSLGCVELPIATAQTVFDHLAIGDLVTVAN